MSFEQVYTYSLELFIIAIIVVKMVLDYYNEKNIDELIEFYSPDGMDSLLYRW